MQNSYDETLCLNGASPPLPCVETQPSRLYALSECVLIDSNYIGWKQRTKKNMRT